jgi:hypothetical protein
VYRGEFCFFTAHSNVLGRSPRYEPEIKVSKRQLSLNYVRVAPLMRGKNTLKPMLRLPPRPEQTEPPQTGLTMTDKLNHDALQALKIAFTYMPKAIEVTKYEYGDNYQTVLEHIQTVRETLLLNDVDPEEVYGEINPNTTPRSSY